MLRRLVGACYAAPLLDAAQRLGLDLPCAGQYRGASSRQHLGEVTSEFELSNVSCANRRLGAGWEPKIPGNLPARLTGMAA
jgi:hypothetical protein